MSWENPPYSNSDEYEKLCEEATPSDFYVCVKEEMSFTEGFTFVAITPKAYFHKHGYMWDQSMFLDHILPSDLVEAMECVWECERPADEVRKDLLARGFQENDEFSKSVEGDYD